jgi:putative phosphoesterase
MKILVFSDTHKRIRNCINVINANKEVDLIIHLGDVLQDALDLESLFPKIKIEYVTGNNDFSRRGNKEKLITVDNKKIFLTHGHLYKVKYTYEIIKEKAYKLDADILLFGHTHEPYLEQKEGLYIMNPGSISLPNYRKPSFGTIELLQGKIFTSISSINI